MKQCLSIVLAVTLTAAFAANAQPSPMDNRQPRQVVLIIGDGMDEQQIAIARNYLKGATGRLVMDDLPLRAAAQILTIEDKVGGKPMYVADSANTATSIATGEITSRGRIATAAGSDEDLTTIVQLAKVAGLKTGLVTTASVTDATLAAFITHISFRQCENPSIVENVVFETAVRDFSLGGCPQDAQKNGGPGAISEQLASSPVDIILGGGAKHFAVRTEAGSGTVLELAQAQGFQTIDSLAQLQRRQPGRPVLGLFADSHLPLRLQGEDGRVAERPTPSLLNRLHPYLGSVTLPETMICEPNPAYGETPSLQQMTATALEHLAADNKKGFFLMVESASIDKAAHKRNPCGSIGEVAQLEEALQTALAFASEHPQTLVLVTADHTQAAQLIPYISLYAKVPVPIYTPGYLARIETPEGGIMVVNYATNNFNREEHTGAAVPVYANAEGIGRVPSFVQQRELFGIMSEYLGLP